MAPLISHTTFVLVCILLAEIANVLSALLLPLGEKGVRIIQVKPYQPGRPITYLAGGLLSRTPKTFAFLDKQFYDWDGGIFYLEYRNFGLDLSDVQHDLCHHLTWHDTDQVTVISASLGYAVSATLADLQSHRIMSQHVRLRQIALNPCTGRASLQRKAQKLAWLVYPAKVLTFLLGWLAFIPLIPTANSRWYSLALFVDQAWICCGEMRLGYLEKGDVVVLSRNDEILDNRALKRQFRQFRRVAVRTIEYAGHVDFERHPGLYYTAFRDYL